MGGIAIP
ncbi:hypothetical protein LINPERHAP1_LOCUS4935 [Linum perenne]